MCVCVCVCVCIYVCMYVCMYVCIIIIIIIIIIITHNAHEYVDKRKDGTIPPDRLGQRVVMTHKLVHSLGGGPTFSKMMPVSILTTTHSVRNNDGSTTTIETPCFPGFTPGVRPRIISVFAPGPDSSPRTVDASRAMGGKLKWGKGHKRAPDTRPSEQDTPCSTQQPQSAGLPKRWKRTRKGR